VMYAGSPSVPHRYALFQFPWLLGTARRTARADVVVTCGAFFTILTTRVERASMLVIKFLLAATGASPSHPFACAGCATTWFARRRTRVSSWRALTPR